MIVICTEKKEEMLLNTVLNDLKMGIFVTDINTDEIIFMNSTMKEAYRLEEPEGKICWQVLQKGRTQRCEFCPIEGLLHCNEQSSVYQWDEISPVTRRSYRNYDSLITWTDGRIVHLQQSADISELESARTDELTKFMTRRLGKEKLKKLLTEIRGKKNTMTVCLYDINSLKEVNARYGHGEGDRMIAAVADVVRNSLRQSEFAFRLSGDEFAVVFLCRQKEAKKRMEVMGRIISQMNREYKFGFSFGLVEVPEGQSFTADEVLFLADKRMYEMKRRYHIELNNKRTRLPSESTQKERFEYDTERLYDALSQSTDDYIYICNMKTGIFRYSKAMVEEFALPGEIIKNAAAVWGSKVHEEDKAAFLESNQEITDVRSTSHCVEYRAMNRKGEWVWVRCRGHLELDENGEPVLFAGFITNQEKRNKIDNLTGLFNKLEFEVQIKYLLTLKESFSVMLLGIDDLKNINDLYNRAFGDSVIRIASQRLQSLLPDNAAIYRLDGDEFGIIIRDGNREIMERYYKAVYHSFESQQMYDGKKYYCTFSGGCVFCPEDGESYEDIRKYAGYCLDFSKTHGKKQCTYFSQNILSRRAHSLEMIELLRESVEEDFKGFSLRYQPLVDMASGHLWGVEALARWRCDKFGQVPPVDFIPLLESTGLIMDVGKWILKTAILTCKSWVALDPEFTIDVNLSYVQMQDFNFLTYVKEVLEEEKFLSKNLVLELTESYFVGGDNLVRDIFNEIRGMGIRIAMDDFGTGYSTLGILKESPADIVKIDKTFIRDIGSSSFDSTFIQFIVELCHVVGIKVCLEGVETRATYDIVSRMGLDMIQGYLFDKPLPEDEFTKKYFGSVLT